MIKEENILCLEKFSGSGERKPTGSVISACQSRGVLG